MTATVRNPDHRDAVAELGADVVLDPEGFAEHGPFDVVLELVGAPNLAANLDALATGGRIAVIGVGAGNKAELSLLALMGKRARIMASTLRARPLEEKAMTARALERNVLPLFERGALRVPVAATYPLDEVARRLRALRRRRQARQDRPAAVNTVERLWRAIAQRDWAAMGAQLQPNIVVELPGTGERLVGPDAYVLSYRLRPGPVTVKVRDIVSAERCVAVHAVLTTPAGDEHVMGFYDMQETRISHAVELWSGPGATPPPAWRAP